MPTAIGWRKVTSEHWLARGSSVHGLTARDVSLGIVVKFEGEGNGLVFEAQEKVAWHPQSYCSYASEREFDEKPSQTS